MCAIPKATAHDKFDHVLIDMNQLLHVCLRKSRSEGHALTLLMKELDECCRMATPTQSLVLAMDGPPSASKLATQRQRRLQTIVRTERKVAQMDQLSSSGKNVFSKGKQARKRRRYQSETNTLCITPGTDFMKLTEQCILYWAWQRQQHNNPNHYLARVKIYISPSTVAGEGEVKLLEWILRQRKWPANHGNDNSSNNKQLQQQYKQGESIAILGGDSDLVLEGLVIPPSFSHNVFVLLPDGNRKYLSVSLWETTRTLGRFLPKDLPPEAALRVRTDLVLLLILNGNDYFPKLRGSSGFHKVFHTYLRTLREWLAADDKEHHLPFLVEPESLTYNVPFCIAFFRHLEKLAPPNLLWVQQNNTNSTSGGDGGAVSAADRARASRVTPLAKFNSLVDAGFFPKPIHWKILDVTDEDTDDDGGGDDDRERELSEEDDIINNENDKVGDDELELDDEEDDDDDELDEEDDDEDGDDTEDEASEVRRKQQLFSLRIGKPGTEDYVSYEVWQTKKKTMKRAKHRLASMALEDLFGEIGFFFDDNGYAFGGETVGGRDTYAWDIRHPVDGKPETYLGGLLWNLQTYQDGVCPDYNFNYGKRHAPTAGELVRFLKEAQEENTELGLRQLMGNSTGTSQDPTLSYPISAGVSCLAALPSQVRNLVPEPYRYLDIETVDKFHGECMDPTDNVFDIKKFERLCDEKVVELGYVNGNAGRSPFDVASETKRIDSSNYWIVLAKAKKPLKHPIDPPPPFSEYLSELRPNNRIKVNRVKAVWQPRPRAAWEEDNNKKKPVQPDPFFSRFESLEEIQYKVAYKRGAKKDKNVKGKNAIVNDVEDSETKKKKARRPATVTERMLTYKLAPPSKKPSTNTDGQSAVACLKQLQDAGLIGENEWSRTMPSPSSYAAFNPDEHELVRLTVNKGADPKQNILKEALVYEQDRDINHASKQAIKHHLATFALCDITGPEIRWSEFTFKDLKEHIALKYNTGSIQ